MKYYNCLLTNLTGYRITQFVKLSDESIQEKTDSGDFMVDVLGEAVDPWKRPLLTAQSDVEGWGFVHHDCETEKPADE